MIGLEGCSVSSLNLFSETSPEETRHVFIPCTIEYGGDKAYLPEFLREHASSKCNAKYQIKSEVYDESSFLDWMNPLYPFGYSIGDQGYMIEVELNVSDGDQKNHRMNSSCKVEKKFSLFNEEENNQYRLLKCQKQIKEDLNHKLFTWKKDQH